MPLSQYSIAFLAAAITTINAAPHPQQQLSTTTTVAPTVITGDKMGAVTYLDDISSTMVVYQAQDGSVHSLTGNGPPSSTSYADGLVLDAATARNDTPLALGLGRVSSDAGVPHLYYLSATECSGGNYLREAYRNSTSGTWMNGGLNDLDICSSGTSNFLYALAPQENAGPNSGVYDTWRVGYVQANDNHLCEAFFGGKWLSLCF